MYQNVGAFFAITAATDSQIHLIFLIRVTGNSRMTVRASGAPLLAKRIWIHF